MKKEYKPVKAAYPVAIQKDNDDFLVNIPDWKSNTSGKSLVDAIEMARNAISEEVLAKQDLGLPIPEPSTDYKGAKNEIVTYVDIDLDRYRRLTDSRTVKKTVTIPSYLNELGTKNKINFSETLTTALKEKLNA